MTHARIFVVAAIVCSLVLCISLFCLHDFHTNRASVAKLSLYSACKIQALPDVEIQPQCGKSVIITKENTHVWRSLLYEFDEIATLFEAKFWLSEGTALGAIRDGDLIIDDTDIDVGMYVDDFKKLFPAAWPHFETRGYTLKRRCPFSIQKCIGDDYFYIDIDITDADMPCMAYEYPVACKYHMHTIEPFTYARINGRRFSCPSMEYIRFLYGDGWSVKSMEKPASVRSIPKNST
tara:strand:+ start:475 stop:1179 length:705 start_codon:yes stop_codon:yes gene_type:complete